MQVQLPLTSLYHRQQPYASTGTRLPLILPSTSIPHCLIVSDEYSFTSVIGEKQDYNVFSNFKVM